MRQFEFVTRCWVNNPDFKEPGTGIDPILGQSNDATVGRARTFKVPLSGVGEQTVTAPTDFVSPTGGGYFFAPSMQALRLLAGELTLTEASAQP